MAQPQYLEGLLCNIPIPPIDDVRLKRAVSEGRAWNYTVHWNVDQFNSTLIKMNDNRPDPRGEKFQHRSIIEDYWQAWTEHDTTHGGDANTALLSIGGVVETLPVGKRDLDDWLPHCEKHWLKPRLADTRLFNMGPNIRLEIRQDKPYPRIDSPKTQAHYETPFNVVAGIIITSERLMQQQMQPATPNVIMSSLTQWPDLTWAVWNRLHCVDGWAFPNVPHSYGYGFHERGGSWNGSQAPMFYNFNPISTAAQPCQFDIIDLGGMRQFLNYIKIQSIESPPTVAVIMRCLKESGVDAGHVPIWGSENWGQQTYRVGHWAFYALLATDVGSNIAQILSLHKDSSQLGLKMLKSVTIFRPEVPASTPLIEYVKYYKWPSMVWEVVDTDTQKDELVSEARRTEEQWARTVNGKPQYIFPCIPHDRLGPARWNPTGF